METIKGKPVVSGKARGQALVSHMPMNFTASFSKLSYMVPFLRSKIGDQKHDLFGKKIENTVLVFPAAIGSTFTGMVILQLIFDACHPAAMIVQAADSLLVSGSLLGGIWLGRGIPIVEYRGEDLYNKITTGDMVEVDGETGDIIIIEKK